MLVLSEKIIDTTLLNEKVELEFINGSTVKKYNGSKDVLAIICSRSTAKVVVDMKFPNVKLLNLTSAGYDQVPLEKYAQKGIPVANAGGTYSVPIAETVVFGMLQMAKKYRKNPNNRHFKITRNYNYISELKDKEVVILGTGNIGTEIAKRLFAFEMNIVGYDNLINKKDYFRRVINNKEELKAQLSKCNYIISTLPNNENTKDFINNEILSCLSKDCIIVNVGRMSVFNEEELYKSLKSKAIGGAVLDMFEKLPNPITNRFRRLSNVIILPGVAAISKEANKRLEIHLANNVNRVALGDKPICIVNGINN
jgi:phosphoglycerate dehydrogenase-like enzyme